MIPCPKTFPGFTELQDSLKERFPDAKERERMASFAYFRANWGAKEAGEVKMPDKETAMGYFKPVVTPEAKAVEKPAQAASMSLPARITSTLTPDQLDHVLTATLPNGGRKMELAAIARL